MKIDTSITRIAAESTPSFLRLVFDLYKHKKLFAIVRQDVANDARLVDTPLLQVDASPRTGWFKAEYDGADDNSPAQIVFSSGTEGQPKAIILTHRNLNNVVSRLNAVMQVTEDIREYVGVPVTYSFGLGRVRAAMAAGGSVYIPAKFNPHEICQMLANGEINAFSAVPSLCRILLQAPEMFSAVGDRVRWIEIGSQYMTPEEKIAIREMFPRARIIQHYGLTEASRTTFLDISNCSNDELSSVGKIDSDIDIRINESGAICIHGDHVASHQMLTATECTELTTDDGWLITKDKGEIRNGHLYFLGRLDDQINVSGVKLSSEHLEQRITAVLPELLGCFAITAVNDPMRGQVPLLALERRCEQSRSELLQEMSNAMGHYGVSGGDVFKTIVIDELPVTGSGKIQRSQLRSLYVPEPIATRKSKRPLSIREVYESHFPNASITPETTFEKLGGDSLNFLSVSLDFEKILGELPENWRMMTVADLEKIKPSKKFMSRIDSATMLRALSIVLIVAGHFGLMNYGGTGAILLFFIGGMSFGAMTLPAVIRSKKIAPIYILLLRIALMTWAYITLNWVLTGYGSLPAYLFITNWIAPNYAGGVWFVSVYIQVALVLALLLSSHKIKGIVAKEPFAVSLGLTLLLILTMNVTELLVDTHDLYRRLPQIMGWMFTCGIAAHYADTWERKCITILAFSIGWISYAESEALRYVLFAVPILLCVPSVRLPQVTIPAVRLVAAASLLIYLSHFQFRRVLDILGISSPFISTIFAVIGGTLAYLAYQPIDDRVRKYLAQKLM